MPGVLILDELQSATEGGGIKLAAPLQTQDGADLLSPTGQVSVNFDNVANNSIHMNKLIVPDDIMSGDKIHGGTISGLNKIGLGANNEPSYAIDINDNSFAGSSILLKRTDTGALNDPGIIFSSAHGENSAFAMGGIWWKNNVDNGYNAMIRAKTDDATGTTGRLEFYAGSAVSNQSTPQVKVLPQGIMEVSGSDIRHFDYSVGQVDSNFHFHRYAQYYKTVSSGAWYTVAINPGNRAGAQFEVYDGTSGLHSHRSFYAGHMYGAQSVIYYFGTVSYSSGGAVRQARIKEGGTYDGAMLQIEVAFGSGGNAPVGIRLYDHLAGSGWYLVNWVPDGTDPGGLNNYSALVNAVAYVNFASAGFNYKVN